MTLSRCLNLFGMVLAVGLVIGFGYAAFMPSKPMVAEKAKAADLFFVPDILDFGDTRQQQTLSGELELHNSFPVAVNIGLIAPSCSCAAVDLEPKRIEPNQSAKLKVAWKTGTRRDASKDQIVLVGTLEDEKQTTIQRIAKLKANVRPDYRIEPSELHFGPEGGTKTVRLIPDAAQDVKIKSVHAAAVGVTAKLDEATGVVELTCPNGLKPGDKYEVLIRTDSVTANIVNVIIHISQ
jgi:hypothetical protein